MPKIFISYSRSDGIFLDQFAPLIRKVYGNDSVWYDQDIHGGAHWWELILAQVGEADLFIYLVSNESLESSYCQAELREALRLYKPILPVIVRRLKPPYPGNAPDDLKEILNQKQFIDFSGGFKDANIVASLYGAIHRLLSQPVQTSSVPSVPTPPPPVTDKKKSGWQSITQSQAAVITGFLGLIGVVVTALIGILPSLLQNNSPINIPTATVTSMVIAQSITETATSTIPPTETVEPTATFTVAPSNTVVPATTVAPPTSTFTVIPPTGVLEAEQIIALVGNFQDELGCPGEWEPACSTTFLSDFDGDGVWTGTFSLNAGNHEYKIALDGAWDKNYGKDGESFGENIPLTLTRETVVVFTYDEVTNEISDSVNLPELLTDQLLTNALHRAGNTVEANNEWVQFSYDFDGVTMVLVPVGCFTMGYRNGDDDEKPETLWCVDEPFWIDKYEVTIEQFDRLDGEAESPSHWTGMQRPRENITRLEASNFCKKRGGRLPTEAEWEYAVRGPDNNFFPWGNEWDASKVVWNTAQSTPVGGKPGGSSWVGALDMIGNVLEWTDSQYRPYPYEAGNKSGVFPMVVRGGSWFSKDAANLRATDRSGSTESSRNSTIGFRCVMDVE